MSNPCPEHRPPFHRWPQRWLALAMLLVWALLPWSTARAEDTDIFSVNPSAVSERPNILIILDNTANWNTPFTAEIAALQAVFGSVVDDRYNVGLMLFTETGAGNSSNPCAAAFPGVGNSGADGGYVRSHIRQMTVGNRSVITCTINNLNKNNDKSNGGKAGLTLSEAHRYLTGGDSVSGGPPVSSYGNHKAKSDTEAFVTGTARYKSLPSGCARSFIIYISNGPVQDNTSDTNAAGAALIAAGGSTAQVTLSPNGSQSNMADEWTRFLFASRQIISYTIDVLPGSNGQGPGWTALLRSMAVQGRGRYFAATSTSTLQADINKALTEIFQEVLPINSVFASSALPVSNNVRGTFLNQVYLGVFRPDANSAPNWAGNLKQYQLAADRSTVPPTVYLADSRNIKALDDNTGFIIPSAISYWTTGSSFWNASFYPSSQGSGGVSDSPDGELIEKGGAAQALRTLYASSQSARRVYTCTGACTAGSSLSATPFDTTNANVVISGATSAERTSVINWVRGTNTRGDDNPSGSLTAVRGMLHGDVIHSRTAVINYGRNGDDVMLFYGAGDGLLHAVRGGRVSSAGQESWAFVAPEHFGALKRLHDHVPLIASGATKPYFIDGSPSAWTYSSANDGVIDHTRGDKAYLFLTMRRGGRLIYALDVSNPDDPKLLWKRSSSDAGFAALAQTWSQPQMVRIRAQAGPVLIMGMGYDSTANDPATQGTPTIGRGIMVLDAATGNLLWQAGASVSGAPVNLSVPGMTYDIAADLAVIDSNYDGKADRIYAADTGGNLWRVNINADAAADWTVQKVAALGGSGANARKFLFAPDVVLAEPGGSTDTLLIGAGDREHPFDTVVRNRYYAIKDSHTIDYIRGTVLTEADLYDSTTSFAPPASAAGWYVTLEVGEKVVGGSTTLNGTVIFGTNIPATAVADSCAALGEARLYSVNYKTGAPATNLVADGRLDSLDRYAKTPGGGLPPTPVPVSVVIDGQVFTVAISGPNVVAPPGPEINRRYRQYWRKNRE
ncbi:PilC/PilY family type IV pilus protein [Nevskia sp.]|uniref:pilus assembly protein n=1 Tax=Nevskia sp. TaxID=1929292 RepID=UPI0025D9746E|nr:PilC/PilY family type IV pilus protein [Nevskia sp.]